MYYYSDGVVLYVFLIGSIYWFNNDIRLTGEPMAEFREGDNVTVTWHLGYPHRVS